jgi:hypothetical protein
MPAPFTIATVVDADGDEFPIRLEGDRENTTANRDVVLRELERMVQEGNMNPTYPVTMPSEKWRRPSRLVSGDKLRGGWTR